MALADATKDEAVTREDALAMYHPIRAAVRRILSSAISVCNQSDLTRAAKQLGLWAGRARNLRPLDSRRLALVAELSE
jgi:hypothetical protein